MLIFQIGQRWRFCWKQKIPIIIQDCSWQRPVKELYGLTKCHWCLWTHTRYVIFWTYTFICRFINVSHWLNICNISSKTLWWPFILLQGHGFRNDLFKMLADLKPGFIRFPGIYCFICVWFESWTSCTFQIVLSSVHRFNFYNCNYSFIFCLPFLFYFHVCVIGGCFVEGEWLRNAFRWKETIGAWEERPGHFGDVWMYWTDDGLGHFEFLQVTSYP